MSEHWGIVGGMGPLASAVLLQTIYERSSGRVEQEMPIVSLVSDPTVPDRTEAFVRGEDPRVAARLEDLLRRLIALGATRTVIACVTAHHALPLVAAPLRETVRHLVDVTLDAVTARDEVHVLFCSSGTRRMRLFERSPLWPAAASRIVWPDDREQAALHHLIYEIKQRGCQREHVALMHAILAAHRATSFIAGCTELHVLRTQGEGAAWRELAARAIDPLECVADEIAGRASSASAPVARLGVRA